MASKLQLIGLFIFIWLLIVYYLYNKSSSDDLDISRRLQVAQNDIASLTKHNEALSEELRRYKRESLADQVGVDKDSFVDHGETECQQQLRKLENMIIEMKAGQVAMQSHDLVQGVQRVPGMGPSAEHEEIRMRLTNNAQELWFYLKAQLRKVKAPEIASILEDVGHHHRSLMLDLQALAEADNSAFWRQKEHTSLQDLMQRRLHYLQNPKDCSSAKKLVCNLNKGCGYGCQLHHAVYCFMIAYGTQRTFILESAGWRYASAGWESVFQPLSESCTTVKDGEKRSQWVGEEASQTEQVVSLPIVDAISNRPMYMPLSIPEDLEPRLSRLHGDPAVWFIGQFVKYLLRPQPHLRKDLEEVQAKFGFSNPIVGIHVRRTDKIGTEAAFHSIEEYMEHVEEWFLTQERVKGRIDKRRVYLASDDANVLPDARKKYPKYEFIGDVSVAESAGLSSRYSDASLRGVIIDIHFLSLCDYIVCTFSSQVCRVAYEVMQTLRPDAAHLFHSLDDIYYFGGQMGHEETVMYAHNKRSQSEIDLEPGDVVGIAGNHWDGYSKGQNRRTGGIGLYPSYKTKDKRVVVKYPTYPEVPDNPS